MKKNYQWLLVLLVSIFVVSCSKKDLIGPKQLSDEDKLEQVKKIAEKYGLKIVASPDSLKSNSPKKMTIVEFEKEMRYRDSIKQAQKKLLRTDDWTLIDTYLENLETDYVYLDNGMRISFNFNIYGRPGFPAYFTLDCFWVPSNPGYPGHVINTEFAGGGGEFWYVHNSGAWHYGGDQPRFTTVGTLSESYSIDGIPLVKYYLIEGDFTRMGYASWQAFLRVSE